MFGVKLVFVKLAFLSVFIFSLMLGFLLKFYLKNINADSKKQLSLNKISSKVPKNNLKESDKDNSVIFDFDYFLEQNTYFENKLKFVEKDEDKLKPKLAIVIDNLGIDFLKSSKILSVDGIFTVSYSSYSDNLQSQINYAKSLGHEVLLNVPFKKDDMKMDTDGLKKLLNGVSGYMGINLNNRFIFNVNNIEASNFDKDLNKNSVLNVVADVIFSDDIKQQDMIAGLSSLFNISVRNGYVSVIVYPTDSNIKMLNNWLSLNKDKFSFVPFSFLVDKNLKVSLKNK